MKLVHNMERSCACLFDHDQTDLSSMHRSNQFQPSFVSNPFTPQVQSNPPALLVVPRPIGHHQSIDHSSPIQTLFFTTPIITHLHGNRLAFSARDIPTSLTIEQPSAKQRCVLHQNTMLSKDCDRKLVHFGTILHEVQPRLQYQAVQQHPMG
jgi:hypothetical protein